MSDLIVVVVGKNSLGSVNLLSPGYYISHFLYLFATSVLIKAATVLAKLVIF
jgi:hypothetical protein